MMSRRFLIALAICWGASVISAQVRPRDDSWTAPVNEVSKSNPLAGRNDVLPGGTKLFRERCASCHGEDGRGTAKAPDLAQDAVQTQSDGALFWKISGGNTHGGMPAFSFLPEQQRWQLVLRVRSLSKVGE
jgi:mono/diheme cytochrome c family protein